jgi:hypothetical protein
MKPKKASANLQESSVDLFNNMGEKPRGAVRLIRYAHDAR